MNGKMEYQLRIYEVKKGKMESWLAEWNSKIRPLRESHGFKIVGGWTLPKQNKFVWILGWNGRGKFSEADARYYESTARKKITPDPARHLRGAETSVMESALQRSPPPGKREKRRKRIAGRRKIR